MSEECRKVAWGERERVVIEGLLDQIIPASDDGRIPAAGTLGVPQFIAEQATRVPGLEDLLGRGLRVATALAGGGGISEELVRELERREPVFFSALVKYTYMGYYTDPGIPPLFGLSDKPPQPDGYDVPDDDPEELAGLVEPVKSRGKCYREG